MNDETLTYDGTVYRLPAALIRGLLDRGVIVADPMIRGSFELGPEHLIEEIEAGLAILDHRTGAEARGEGDDLIRQRMLAVRFRHSDGQGGR